MMNDSKLNRLAPIKSFLLEMSSTYPTPSVSTFPTMTVRRNTDNEMAEKVLLARDQLFEKILEHVFCFRLIFGLEKNKACNIIFFMINY